MGNLNKVTMLQEEYRDLLRDQQAEKSGGPTLLEEAVQGSSRRYTEDAVVNTAVALHGIYGDEHFSSDLLRDAVTLLDYWDSLGMEVRFKQ